jgi:uncharacterized protein YdhG (YjbR/CyaY superfamily)
MTHYDSVESYIATFPLETQKLIEQIRTIIKQNISEVEEKISYDMPCYKHNRILIYFAGYAKHIGFYPGAACIIAFHEKLTNYKTSKGTVQFPLNKPLPLELIAEMVRYKLVENTNTRKLK